LKTIFGLTTGEFMRSTDFSRLLIPTLLAVFLLAVLPSSLLAAEGEHGGEKGGLGFTSIHRYDLFIYTLVVFGILIFILSKYAWPHIKEGLEKREAAILGARQEAKQERIDAEAKLAEAKRQLDQAAAQAKAIVDEARKAAEALKANEVQAGVKEAEAKKQQADREIAAMKDSLLKELYEKAVQLATLMSEKALRREVSAADHSRLLDESLAELRAASKA
jgi:F-type H+-transporting ATPase subunit b